MVIGYFVCRILIVQPNRILQLLQFGRNMDYSKNRLRIIDWLKSQLIGPAVAGNLSDIPPLKRYPVGVLFPTIESGEGLDPADEANFEMDGYATKVAEDSDEEGAVAGVARKRYIPPSSVGFSFFVSSAQWKIQIWSSAAIYSQKKEEARNEQGQFERPEYVRRVIGGDDEAFFLTSGTRDKAVFAVKINDKLTYRAGIMVQERAFLSGKIITVSLFNTAQMANSTDPKTWTKDSTEKSLFEVQLKCIIEQGEVGNYPSVDYSLLDEEMQELELQYKHKKIYAIGHGSATDWKLENGQVTEILSDFMPVIEVPQVTADVATGHSKGGSPVLKMSYLVSLQQDKKAVCHELQRFVAEYDEWISERLIEVNALNENEQRAGFRITACMTAARDRMNMGINLLLHDQYAAKAFVYANQAMLDQMHQHSVTKGKTVSLAEYQWRPFQLAFLLTTIKSAIDTEDDFRDVVDLIWFPTGGGKTEAYLGLIAFVIAWRRLKFPQSYGGTTSLMRYTLRLLTTQQFIRATKMICALELIRQKNSDLGTEMMSIGLWVGGETSPNSFIKAIELLDKAAQGQRSTISKLVIEQCPWCGDSFKAPRNYIAKIDSFKFFCVNLHCDFGGHNNGELPCNVIDEALFKQPPTLLIATIDKFARMAWEDRVSSFFGQNKNRPPELIVQDELHLIAGALGSVAGIYEAALETVLVQHGVHPKYIASTATIRMAEDQIKKLYAKKVAIFPPAGISAEDSFFAKTVPTSIRSGRMYIGYFAPMLNRQNNMVPLAASLLAAPESVFQEGEIDRDLLLEAWWSQVIYHGSLKGVGSSHNAFNIGVKERFARLLSEQQEQNRANVSNPQGMQKFKESGSMTRLLQGITLAQLTSNSSAEENAQTFARLELTRQHEGYIDAVLATNMVSVGLDVSRLALMVINGQPLTTAEYIQASSRVGRSSVPGLVFANYYRDQARSLSHYENFRPYHESFYRFVEPTSVTPYTFQARRRALHAGLVISLRHSLYKLRDNSSALSFDPSDPVTHKVILDFTKRCMQSDPDKGEEIKNHIQQLVEQWQELAANCMAECRQLSYQCRDNDRSASRLLYNHGDNIQGLWPTLHSMRNVESTGLLKPL